MKWLPTARALRLFGYLKNVSPELVLNKVTKTRTYFVVEFYSVSRDRSWVKYKKLRTITSAQITQNSMLVASAFYGLSADLGFVVVLGVSTFALGKETLLSPAESKDFIVS